MTREGRAEIEAQLPPNRLNLKSCRALWSYPGFLPRQRPPKSCHESVTIPDRLIQDSSMYGKATSIPRRKSACGTQSLPPPANCVFYDTPKALVPALPLRSLAKTIFPSPAVHCSFMCRVSASVKLYLGVLKTSCK